MQTIQLRSSLNPDSDPGASPQGEAWLDIERADGDGLGWLASQGGLDDQIVRRLLEPAPTTYWRRFGQGLHLNVHSTLPDAEASEGASVDYGIWLEPDRIITVRHGRVPALEKAAEACSQGTGPSSSWGLLVFLLSEGVSRVEHDLLELSAAIDRLEDDVLTGEGDPPIDRVAELQRRLVYARRSRVPLANVVGFISSQPDSLTDEALRDELEGLANLVAQQQDLLGLSIERASALQGQIRDQLADSMNNATYRFTWVATVFLPLSFLTGLLGINVAGIPGDHDPLGFWLVCGVLCVVAASWGILVGRTTSPFGGRRRPRDP